jgi:hypothetical protein
VRPSPGGSRFLIAALTSILLTPGPSSANFAFSGCRWSSGDIGYVDDSGPYQRATAAAARRWNLAVPGLYLHSDASAAWIVQTADLGPTNLYGVTTWYCRDGRLLGVVSRYNTYYTDGFNLEQRVSVMIHEMGHGLGLAHVAAAGHCPVPIMTASFSQTWGRCHESWPQPADLEGVAVLYGKPG